MARQHTQTRPRERTVRVQFEVSRLAATHLHDACAHVVPQPRWSRRNLARGPGLAVDARPLRRRGKPARSVQVACYARVASDQQATTHTSARQVAALRERSAADGLTVDEEGVFIDDGYSGTHLLRPALERLRDLAASGGSTRLYLHSPDRLHSPDGVARKDAYQVLLVEALRRAGVPVTLLHPPGDPEDAVHELALATLRHCAPAPQIAISAGIGRDHLEKRP